MTEEIINNLILYFNFKYFFFFLLLSWSASDAEDIEISSRFLNVKNEKRFNTL